ncbi:MAG TPA: BON domain-containing protein [Opitutaceae bacterium]|nr:BON domain-containing protein [Opitutaceae bacterium]
MKKPLQVLTLSIGISVVCTTLFSGCAATPTKESTGEYVDDSSVTAKVKGAFAADKMVSPFQVKVNTYRGVVQLSGFVDTPDQKTRAEEVARGVAGVKSVDNRITVK